MHGFRWVNAGIPRITDMHAIDRTHDFMGVVSALRSTEIATAIPVRPPQPPGLKPGASDHARFSATVSSIGREIHETSMKLAEMTRRKYCFTNSGALA